MDDGATVPDKNHCKKDDVNVIADLKNFKFTEILGEDSAHKVASVLFDVGDSGQAVLVMEKTPFPMKEEEWNRIVSDCSLRTLFSNDIYGSYILFPPVEFTGFKTTLINPCTVQHIEKYREQKRYVVYETSEDYKSITLPYLESEQLSLEWIFNLLDHKAEVSRIIFEDADPQNGFILVQDIRWDGKELTNLYVQAVVKRKGIKSIRDLTKDDLPLLENIREKSYTAIKGKYGIDRHQIRAFVHYQPSFYHFHIHFIHVSYDAPGSSVAKAYLLEDVLNNISLLPDYYQRSTLTFILKENSPLLQLFRNSQKW